MADYTLFKLRGDTRANWLSSNPILNSKEIALETDTKRFKVGDGTSTYAQLTYGRNTGEYLNFYNVTALFPLNAGYYYTHESAISAVPSSERCKGSIVSYETASGVWYTERFIGTDVANWSVLANWEKVPDASDIAQIRSETNQMVGGMISGSYKVEKYRYFVRNGNEVNVSNENFYGVALYVPQPYRFLVNTSKVSYAHLFNEQPIEGSQVIKEVNTLRESDATTFEITESNKWILITFPVEVNVNELFIYNLLQKQIVDMNNSLTSGVFYQKYSGLYVYGETTIRQATSTYDSYLIKVDKSLNYLYLTNSSGFVYAQMFSNIPKEGDVAIASVVVNKFKNYIRLDIPQHTDDIYVVVTINKTLEPISIITESHICNVELLPSIYKSYNLPSSELMQLLDNNGWLTENGDVEYPISSWINGYVDIQGAISIELNHIYNSYSSSIYVFICDADKNVITKYQISNDRKYVEVPNNAKYLRMCLWINGNSEFYLNIYKQDTIGLLYAKVEQNYKAIEAISTNTKIIAPKEFWAVQGFDLNIYYDTIVKAKDNGLYSPENYYIDVSCPVLHDKGFHDFSVRRDRMWQLYGSQNGRTANIVGDYDLYIKLYDAKYNFIDSQISTLHILAAEGLDAKKNILIIGDSITNNGSLVPTIIDDFNDVGGVLPTLIGTRKTNDCYHEGYPGYTFQSFVSNPGFTTYVFQVPILASVKVFDEYLVNNVRFVVSDVRIENETTKSVRCDGSGTPPINGIMIWYKGDTSSDKEIAYSSVDVQFATPFFNESTGAIDIANYREERGMGNEKFDVITIMLGCNDSLWGVHDMTSSVNYAKTLIDAFIADANGYNTKIILQLPPLDANTISSWQVYKDDASYSNKVAYQTNIWSLRQMLIDTFTTDAYMGKVFIGQASLGIDRFYGYPYDLVPSSSRISSISEIYHTNSVHPNNEGYQQYGDGYFLQILGLLKS